MTGALPGLVLLLLSASPTIDAWLAACPDAADGFAPVVHGREARAAGTGVVAAVDEGEVEVAHCFYENATPRQVRVRVRGLAKVAVKEGDRVTRGQRLGTGKRLDAGADDGPVAALVTGREALVVPRAEPSLVVVDVAGHQAARFERGVEVAQWEVGQGQVTGAKEWRGDLKTPHGLYFVVQKSTGPFGGPWGLYYGGVWVKVNYPNAFDAQRGVDAGVVSEAQAEAISRAWAQRAPTPQKTKLGGGIGFHGWAEPWDGPGGGYELSWGCVVLHPEQAKGFYDATPVGTAVVFLQPDGG